MKMQNPMGSGMFRFERFRVGEYVELSRFDDFRAGPVAIEGVILKVVPTETTAAAVAEGLVDVGSVSANLDEYATLDDSEYVNIQQFVRNSYNYLGFNLRLPMFRDRKTRAALFFGLNLKDFIETQWDGFRQQLFTPMSPVSWAFPDEDDLIQYIFDPERAAKYLAEAGWADTDGDGFLDRDGEKFSIEITMSDGEVSTNLLAVAQSNWGDLGIEVVPNILEWNAVVATVYGDADTPVDFDMYIMGWSLGADPDPTTIFGPDADRPGGFNSVGFHHERAHELFVLGLLEFDQDKRAEIYREWAKIANYELPYIFMAIGDSVVGVNRRVHGMELGPFYGWTANIDNITLDYTE